MKKAILFIVTAACFLNEGCGGKPEAFTERKIVIASNETVRVKEIDLSITNNGCGRKWISEGDQPSFERPYCDLIIRQGDSSIHAGNDFSPVHISNIEIIIDKMNPWGREEDSVPPGGCRVWVRKIEGR